MHLLFLTCTHTHTYLCPSQLGISQKDGSHQAEIQRWLKEWAGFRMPFISPNSHIVDSQDWQLHLTWFSSLVAVDGIWGGGFPSCLDPISFQVIFFPCFLNVFVPSYLYASHLPLDSWRRFCLYVCFIFRYGRFSLASHYELFFLTFKLFWHQMLYHRKEWRPILGPPSFPPCSQPSVVH